MPGEEPEHRRQFRDSITSFAGNNTDAKDLRADRTGPAGFSLNRYRGLAELGCAGLILPEEFGGLGMETADLAAMHQEFGRAALTEPLAIIPLLVSQTLALGENATLARAYIPDLVAGETLATLAWQGASGTSLVGPVATPEGEGWQLSGQAQFVPLASLAAAMIVAARCEDGVALFWLAGMPEMTQAITHADGSHQATAVFNGFSVGGDALIAGPAAGQSILDHVLDLARLAASAELLGVMERALEMTLDHLRQREQFGKPIGTFQALQHRAVNLYIQVELARSALERATRALDGGGDAATRAAQVSAAKSRAGEAAQLIAREAIQMHGAIGYTTEYDLSLYVNRMLFLSAWLGNARAHRARWAKLKYQAELAGND
jgi:alkylation response protein AidB-like acyl-CoA dehydrogenase